MSEYALAENDPRAAWAIFTISEAARYLGVPPSTLRTWVDPEFGDPLITSFEKDGYQPRLSFVNFAEAFVIQAARKAKLNPRRVRLGVAAVRKELGVEYALATQRLYLSKTDLLVAPKGGVKEGDSGVEIAWNKQLQMVKIIKKELKHIHYGSDGIAESIVLPIFDNSPVKVTVDPYVAFGAPIVARTGTRLRDIVSLKKAGETFRDIAYDFGLKESEVKAVVNAFKEPAPA